jgi:hypothetical protein
MVNEIARIVTIGGMGYSITETPWGMPALTTRLKALGINTGASPYKHTQRQEIYDFLRPFIGFCGLFGDSLGAACAALFAGDQKKPIGFAGGFQPSNYDPVGRDQEVVVDGKKQEKHVIVVPPNVVNAHCIWDPVWIDTIGLGNALYVTTPGAKTILTVTEHRGAHPDDWGWSQNLMVAHLELVLKASGLLK